MTDPVVVQDLFSIGFDPGEIVATIHAAFEEYRGKLKPESGALSETVESITDKSRKGSILGIVEGGRLVACVCTVPKGEMLYLDRLAVRPDHRRRGYAQTLIEAVETEACKRGLRGVSLGVRLALKGNIALFKRLEFEEVGRKTHAGFNAPTSLDMVKRL
jgi:ribosomal protein S18 acetylase RimI-like enzyme